MPDPVPSSPRPPAVNLMRHLGLEPDAWQLEVLEAGHRRLLLNCSRQAGKSTVVGLLGLAEALYVPGTKVLLLSRSFRQAAELFRLICQYHRRLKEPLLERRNAQELLLQNYSRILCLPCNESTVRGYASVTLLVIDEAARVPDDFYRAVRPMLAACDGRLVCLSTPYGRRGFFWNAWANEGADWNRIEVPAERVPRIKAAFLEEERRCLGESWYRQEYCCSFEALEGLVYPDFADCVVDGPAPPGGKRVGGMDFGLRNPFAAVWGTLDRDDVLWLGGEHYLKEQPLSYHARYLPRDVLWYADPSGANERTELRCADFKVREAMNKVQLGIAAVRARLADDRLRVLAGTCPQLLREATLYRYSTEPAARKAELPEDGHDHAMDALRYLVASLDAHHMVRPRRAAAPEAAPAAPANPLAAPPTDKPAKVKRPWLSNYNEFLWHDI